jgi:hypothetical protein
MFKLLTLMKNDVVLSFHPPEAISAPDPPFVTFKQPPVITIVVTETGGTEERSE